MFTISEYLSAVSRGLPDLPKAPPSGELSAQQTERVSHIQHAALRGGTELESCCDEALEQGMCAVGAALELRVELCTQMEGAARQLHGLDQTAVGAGAGNDQTFSAISLRKSLLNS